MDRNRSVNQKKSLSSSIFRESTQNSSEQPTVDPKRTLLNSFPSKDVTKDTIVTSLNPSLSKSTDDTKTHAEKLELNSSSTDASKEPELIENKELPNLTAQPSEEACKKPKVLRKGRFSGHAGRFNLTKNLPQQEIDARFPENFDFEIEHLPERPESPVEEAEPFSKLLDEIPDPKVAFEESFLPFSLNKSDAFGQEFSDNASFSFCEASASPAADSNVPSDHSDNVLDFSKGYLFELEPPYFDESKTFTLLEDPLHE